MISGCLPTHSGITVSWSERVAEACKTPGAHVCQVQSGCPLPAGRISLSLCPKLPAHPRRTSFDIMKLIYGDIMETHRICGCTAAQSQLLATMTELLNIKKFWTNVKCIHPGQHPEARSGFLQANCSSESHARPLLCMKWICNWGCSKLSDTCACAMFVWHIGKPNASERYWTNNSSMDANFCPYMICTGSSI